ncbi:ionotropic receptor 93a [Nephila pilipes]|uniref:Ionotropic receptor 93a n=1 Tax=Nephila pilipes TaxID=299642 RepID=A0A8X6T4J9_NEPPI|nr:ionotropic receptor 93a [Nephila pilipes]
MFVQRIVKYKYYTGNNIRFILSSSENIKIAPVVESFVAQAGLDDSRTNILNLEETLKEIMGNSAELAFTKKVKYQNIGQLLMAYSERAQEISAIVSVVKCSTYLDDLKEVQTNFSSTMSLIILERGCPRPPPTVGLGFPYLKNMNEIVPFLVDIRSDNRLLDKWDDIVIFHDNTIDLNSLEAIVVMLQTMDVRKRSTTLTIYDVCRSEKCEDTTFTIHESLTPYAITDFPKNFLILSTGKTFRKIMEQDKGVTHICGQHATYPMAT